MRVEGQKGEESEESKMNPRVFVLLERVESNVVVDINGECAGRVRFELKNKEFQVVMGHASENVSQAVIYVGLDGRGKFWREEVKLSVISIEMTLKTM